MSVNEIGLARIGTSNVVLPTTKSNFPEQYKTGTRLHYYASIFNTLEVNSSFYKVPQGSTLEKWHNDVPATFKFSVKMWRAITHGKNLTYVSKDLITFLNSVDKLDDKKGCLLIQFPASLTSDKLPVLQTLLKQIQSFECQHPWRICVEFRNSSWYNADVFQSLKHQNISIVNHDMPGSIPPALSDNTNIMYKRYHGVDGKYRGRYPEQFLTSEATEIKRYLKEGKYVFVYFNNTIDGAYEDAIFLQSKLQ